MCIIFSPLICRMKDTEHWYDGLDARYNMVHRARDIENRQVRHKIYESPDLVGY